MFLLAGQEIPGPEYYDEWILLENGVGSVRRASMDFETGLAAVPKMDRRRLRIVTGGSMAPFFGERAGRLADATGARVEVVRVTNAFFGETVTAAGLLAGADILAALGEGQADDLIVLPAEALNADRLFIDSLPLSALEETLGPARVVEGYEITATLRDL
jgi:NifB/MoaA-like Fe-S oxidoreductase